mgnify:CR=1 FL=1
MMIFKWCIKNDIRVYPKPNRPGRFPKVLIVLEYKGQIKVGVKEYFQNSTEYHQKVLEIYEWAYDNANEAIKRQLKVKRDNNP